MMTMMLFSGVLFGCISTSLGCELYMAKSFNENFGRGVFAGRSFRYKAEVEKCPTILVHNDYVLQSQLSYFSYDSDFEEYGVLTFGAGMLYNSMKDKSVSYDWATKIVPPASSIRDHAHTTYTNFAYITEKTIRPGEEVYCYYGEKWFEDRNIKPITSQERNQTKFDLGTLEQEGHCLTDIYFKDSTIPMAGKGVFTKRAHAVGDIVSISPVLVLSRRDIVDVSSSTVLLNYCISQNNSDVALFPLGRAALINHGGISANVQIEWHQWDDSNALNMDVFDLMDLSYSALDIKYVATRDIAIGEELLLDYGVLWEKAWGQYLDKKEYQSQVYREEMSSWNPQTSPKPFPPQPPLFRFYIEAPSGLFPPHFEVPCVGFGCDGDDSELVKAAIQQVDSSKLAIAQSKQYASTHFRSFDREKSESEQVDVQDF